LWLALSACWAVWTLYFPWKPIRDPAEIVVDAIGPPLLLLAAGIVSFWITKGFKG
jgi:hypothetical protein